MIAARFRLATMLALSMTSMAYIGGDRAVERLSPVNSLRFDYMGGSKGRRYSFGEPRTTRAKRQNDPNAFYNRSREINRRLARQAKRA